MGEDILDTAGKLPIYFTDDIGLEKVTGSRDNFCARVGKFAPTVQLFICFQTDKTKLNEEKNKSLMVILDNCNYSSELQFVDVKASSCDNIKKLLNDVHYMTVYGELCTKLS